MLPAEFVSKLVVLIQSKGPWLLLPYIVKTAHAAQIGRLDNLASQAESAVNKLRPELPAI